MDVYPKFLIIGSMKSGTTTLYRDLYTHPQIFLPETKEPNSLCQDDILAPEGRKRYAALFAPARAGQVCGEGSTAYTKLPDFPSVPERALSLLGPDLKLVFVMRDPVARIISHHKHEFAARRTALEVNEAVRQDPAYLNYSRYRMQIEAWTRVFDPANLLLLRFEDYVKDRAGHAAAVCQHIGVAADGCRIEDEKFNKSSGKSTPHGLLKHLVHDRAFYQDWIKPRLPWRLRAYLSSRLFPTAPKPGERASEDTLAFLCENLAGEMDFHAGIPSPCLASDIQPDAGAQKQGRA